MMPLHPKVEEAVALISARLKTLGVQTLNELHDWWVKELQREPTHLKDAIKWLIENKLAVAKTAGSTKMLRLTGDELEHDPPAPPAPPPSLASSGRPSWTPGSAPRPPASTPKRSADAAPAPGMMLHDAAKLGTEGTPVRGPAAPSKWRTTIETGKQETLVAGKWLSTTEAAELAAKHGHDVSRSAIQQWMSAHQLEHKPSGYGKARVISEASLLAYFAARAAHRDVPVYQIAEEPPRADEITIPQAARIIKKAKPTVQQRATKLGLERRMWRGAWLYNRAKLLGAFCIQEVPSVLDAIENVSVTGTEIGRGSGPLGVVVPLRSVAGAGESHDAKKLVDALAEKLSGRLSGALQARVGNRLARLFYRLMNEAIPAGVLWDCIEQLSSPEYDPPLGDPVGEKMLALASQLAERVLEPLTSDE